jgi:hypothetical protein
MRGSRCTSLLWFRRFGTFFPIGFLRLQKSEGGEETVGREELGVPTPLGKADLDIRDVNDAG